MTPTPNVSIIVPTYNREKLLPQTMNSLLNQSYDDFEVIVVDDASTDETRNVLQEYVLKDGRIKVFYLEKNSGVSAARNRGLDNALGRYVAFVDSDDLVHPRWLEKLIAQSQSLPPKNLVYCGTVRASQTNNLFDDEYSENWNSYGLVHPAFAKSDGESFLDYYVFRGQHLLLGSTLWSRDLIGDHRFDETLRIREDSDFIWSATLNSSPSTAFVRENLFLHRVHDSAERLNHLFSFDLDEIERWVHRYKTSWDGRSYSLIRSIFLGKYASLNGHPYRAAKHLGVGVRYSVYTSLQATRYFVAGHLPPRLRRTLTNIWVRVRTSF